MCQKGSINLISLQSMTLIQCGGENTRKYLTQLKVSCNHFIPVCDVNNCQEFDIIYEILTGCNC